MTWLWTWLALGLLGTAAVTLGLRLLPWLSASTRSVVWMASLAAIPVLGGLLASGAPGLLVGDVLVVAPGATVAGSAAFVAPSSAGGIAEGTRHGEVGAASHAGIATWLPPDRTRATVLAATAVFALWAAGTILCLGRLAAGLFTLRRWRARCRPMSAAALDHLPAWRSLRQTGRRAVVAWSPDVPTPCVLGPRAPIIALPANARLLTPAALDAILVHELAHVRRRDDIAQFVQHLVRAFAAGHPAVWWIDRQLTIEREAACDDWVVTLATGPRDYARCLVELASRGTALEALQVAVRGGRSQLAARVRRLVDARRVRRLHAGAGVITSATSGVAAAIVAALTLVAPTVVLPVPAAEARRVSSLRSTAAAQRSLAWPGGSAAALRSTGGSSSRHVQATATRMVAARVAIDRPVRTGPVPAAVGKPAPPDVRLSLAAPARGPRLAFASLAAPLAPAPVPAPRPPSASAVGQARDLTADPAPSSASTSAPAPTPDGRPARAPFIEAGAVFGQAGGAMGGAGMAVGRAGVAIGEAGREAGTGIARGGVATAGFFSRLGRHVAGTF